MELETRAAAGPRPGELDFLWIEDEGLLRDEGVVFGLSGARDALEHKEASIRAYYARWIADADRRRTYLQSELNELRQRRDARIRPEEPILGRDGIVTPENRSGGLILRYGLGMAAAVLACLGTVILVHQILRSGAVASPELVAAGIVAAACFIGFLPVSILFVGDSAPRDGDVEIWKVRLAEFGLPAVSALLVTAWGWDVLGSARAIALAPFLFLVFLFSGKQFLSSILAFWASLRDVRSRWTALRQRRIDEARTAALTGEREMIERRMAEAEKELAAIRSRDEWDAICAAKLALFRSEYELAAARAADQDAVVTRVPVSTNGTY